MAMQDIILDVKGVTFAATIRYGNDICVFIRGNGKQMQNIRIDCANTAFSGLVINGAGNSITGCSVSYSYARHSITCATTKICSCLPVSLQLHHDIVLQVDNCCRRQTVALMGLPLTAKAVVALTMSSQGVR